METIIDSNHIRIICVQMNPYSRIKTFFCLFHTFHPMYPNIRYSVDTEVETDNCFLETPYRLQFLAVLCLHSCAWAFSSSSKWGYSLLLSRLFAGVASPFRGSRHAGFSMCSMQTPEHWALVVVAHGNQLPCGLQDVSRAGIKPMAPALAGGS